MKVPRILLVLVLCSTAAPGQANHGDLRLHISDPSGSGVRALVEVRSKGNGFDESFVSDDRGNLAVTAIPFGTYDILVSRTAFAPFQESLVMGSAIPQEHSIRLSLAPVRSEVTVNGSSTLLDPGQTTSAQQIGTQEIQQRLASLPGRSVQDLVVSQPGWLYEGNAVLHPRGSEYQTQLVVDGIPLIDNRSPGFGPEIDADGLESMTIYTAGFPAEYGRKMGGVVELNTERPNQAGLHRRLILSGGSFDTRSAFGALQETKGKSTFAFTAAGSGTRHYLNPVVPENYTNDGTTADLSARYERTSGNDSFNMSARRELARFLVPDEQVQQRAGQTQNGDTFETLGMVQYQHVASPDILFDVDAMIRRNRNDLYSNVNPTPIAAFQHNFFDEAYGKAAYAEHHGAHEFKAGVESDALLLHEQFQYKITDPTQFDPGTPPSMSFAAHRPDLEQGAFVQDQIHRGGWTASAGLRWDHYQLLLNQNALSPRISAARYFSTARIVVHASYDRVFQTPSFENILISSSPQVDTLDSQFLRLPVPPEHANYYEAGAAQAWGDRVRLDTNLYRRDARDFADDDQLLNTGVSYPIAFRKAVIYGAESKLDIHNAGPLSGFISYSYMVSNVWFPVTGGLFLGQDAANAAAQLGGHFPSSQDQRNTAESRLQYKAAPRLEFGLGGAYGSGLPFDYGGTEAQALTEYGSAVVGRLNFARGRLRPTLAMNASMAVDMVKSERLRMTLRVDGENLNNRLNVLDFGGLFSGNSIAPGRSVFARWETDF